MSARARLAAACLALLAASCDPGRGAPAEQRSAALAEPLLHRIRDAAGSVAHEGVRRYEAHVYRDGGDFAIEYTERVADDGAGCYSMEPLDVRSNTVDPFVFTGLQRERQAFLRRYRDFRIRDLDLFLENYVVRDEGRTGVVAGRPVVELTAESRSAGRRYELSVDAETGLVLAYRETLSDGTLLAAMRYEEYGPLVGEVDCFTSSMEGEPLRLRDDLDEQLGFDVWSPAPPLEGYEPFEASRVRDPRGFDWFKLAFTDGVETLFFLQREPGPPQTRGAPAGPAGAPPAGVHDDRVLVYEAGALSVVQGRLASREVMAVGKVASRELLVLLDSARP